MDWKLNGIRVIKGDQLDTNTPQTPGMNRAAAINLARVGAQKIWAGTVNIHANAKTGAHHHGALESVIYVLRGKARMRWGEKLEYVAEAEAGDFIFVPPYVPHQEINASTDETLECVLVRSDNEAVVVNLDIDPVEKPEAVYWVDPIHKHSVLNLSRAIPTGLRELPRSAGLWPRLDHLGNTTVWQRLSLWWNKKAGHGAAASGSNSTDSPARLDPLELVSSAD